VATYCDGEWESTASGVCVYVYVCVCVCVCVFGQKEMRMDGKTCFRTQRNVFVHVERCVPRCEEICVLHVENDVCPYLWRFESENILKDVFSHVEKCVCTCGKMFAKM